MEGIFRSNASAQRARFLVLTPRNKSVWKADSWIENGLIAGLVGSAYLQAGLALLSI